MAEVVYGERTYKYEDVADDCDGGAHPKVARQLVLSLLTNGAPLGSFAGAGQAVCEAGKHILHTTFSRGVVSDIKVDTNNLVS